MEKDFNEQDSLKIINEMITQARNNIQIGSANSMIFCGYTITAIAILNILLLHMLDKPYLSFWIWLITIPMTIVNHFVIHKRSTRSAIVHTPIDRIISKIWNGFTWSVITLLISIFCTTSIFDNWLFTIFITPTILTLLGLAQFASGYASRFPPFIRGAYIFWAGSVLSVIFAYGIFKSQDIQFVILAICMVSGFIIPGHILNRKAVKNV